MRYRSSPSNPTLTSSDGFRLSGIKKSFSDSPIWTHVYVNEPVQDAQRFLDFVKNMNISKVEFYCDQPPNLFDRLPEYCNVESLVMHDVFSFSIEHLKKFNNLICIDIRGTLA